MIACQKKYPFRPSEEQQHSISQDKLVKRTFELTVYFSLPKQTLALRVKRDGQWTSWTYEQYLSDVKIVAR